MIENPDSLDYIEVTPEFSNIIIKEKISFGFNNYLETKSNFCSAIEYDCIEKILKENEYNISLRNIKTLYFEKTNKNLSIDSIRKIWKNKLICMIIK